MPLLRSLLAAALAIAVVTAAGHAQQTTAEPAERDSMPLAIAPAFASTAAPAPSGTAAHRSHFKTRFALGFVTSILAHEAGHVIAAYAVGGHPSFGFDKGRPTVYSGIDASRDPHKQFIFSSAGLTVQMLLDEAILDVPHRRGGAFERGLLAGGIGTVLFYTTLGRTARVSDITFMSRTSSLSKTEVSLIYGAVAALHVVRIHRDRAYAHFFAAPAEEGGLKVGVVLRQE
jgi:hypothetical protein